MHYLVCLHQCYHFHADRCVDRANRWGGLFLSKMVICYGFESMHYNLLCEREKSKNRKLFVKRKYFGWVPSTNKCSLYSAVVLF